jgi:D-serine deaminase-like pyridoxal phosphate-dependent protein
VLVLDRARMHRNAVRMRALFGPGQRLRLVEKSLPVPRMLDELMQLTGTRALMVFHEPQLLQTARAFPDTDLLLGKPLPVAAARHFYRQLGETAFAPERQLQWLIDTPQRLHEYATLAQELDVVLRITIEIDVGLHRGGVEDAAGMEQMLRLLSEYPQRLHFAGLMGYDAHVGKLPALVESRARGFAKAVETYRGFQQQVSKALPEQSVHACWNGAGSPTIALHSGGDSPLNDVSAGSALLKPSDFDIDLLADFEPALFIATPVLKRLPGVRLPGPEWFSRLLVGGPRAARQSYFIYGGGWPARIASPPELRRPGVFGTSYNQAIYTGPAQPALAVDDLVFLRPHQSEGMLLQFGPIWVFEDGHIVDRWTPFEEP